MLSNVPLIWTLGTTREELIGFPEKKFPILGLHQDMPPRTDQINPSFQNYSYRKHINMTVYTAQQTSVSQK